MGYDLVRGEECFHWSIFNWGKILRLAVDYGWKSKGTVQDGDETWDGSYFGNGSQTVTSDDANKMADALEKALNDKNRPSFTSEDEKNIVDAINCELNRRYEVKEDLICEGFFDLVKANNMTLKRRRAIAADVPNGATLNNLLNIYDQTVRTDSEFSERLRDFIQFLREGRFQIC